MKPPYIRDDLGYAWYFKDGAIRLVLAELEDKVPPELEGKVPSDQNGYACVNLEEGIRLLNEMGYITGYDDDSHPPHGPAVPDATGIAPSVSEDVKEEPPPPVDKAAIYDRLVEKIGVRGINTLIYSEYDPNCCKLCGA